MLIMIMFIALKAQSINLIQRTILKTDETMISANLPCLAHGEVGLLQLGTTSTGDFRPFHHKVKHEQHDDNGYRNPKILLAYFPYFLHLWIPLNIRNVYFCTISYSYYIDKSKKSKLQILTGIYAEQCLDHFLPTGYNTIWLGASGLP